MTGTGAIGFFDSGVGGFSVLRHALRSVDARPLLYVADSAYAPYGGLGPDLVRDRCRQITRFLLEQGAGAIVVACNTATAIAVDRLREEFEIPIVGMEPAVKPAAAQTKSGRIAVLATRGTLHSARYARLRSDHGHTIEVHERICRQWVEAVEDADLDSPRTHDLVNAELKYLDAAGIDTYVLGCTHFAFLEPVIRTIVGDHVAIIDPGPAVVGQLRRRLALESTAARRSPVRFFTSGSPVLLNRRAEDLLGVNVEAESLPF